MSNRRRLLFVVATAVVISSAGIRMQGRAGRVGPTWANYTRIQDGTSFPDAVRILGRPTATNETTGPNNNRIATRITRDDSVLFVVFRPDGTVVNQWFDSGRVTMFDRLMCRVHFE